MGNHKSKNIYLKGNGYSLRAIAMSLPGRDIAISLKMNRTMRQSQVAEAAIEVNEIVTDWYLDSHLWDNRHFIKHLATPSYPNDSIKPMVFLLELSLLSRKEIQMGKEIRIVEEAAGVWAVNLSAVRASSFWPTATSLPIKHSTPSLLFPRMP